MANTELGKAYVQIIPSAKGIKGKIAEEVGAAGEPAGNKFGSALKGAVAKLAIGAAIGKTLVDAFKEGAALQQSIGGIETLFKSSADQMKKYASESWKTTGLSANEYMETATSFSASLLQSLGGDTKKAAQISNMAITDMSDNANKMGTNMRDIQNAYQGFAKQNYTMLDNLKLGYGGTKSEMERLLRDAEKLTGVKYDINNLSDVYNAIHAIQGKLDITGTTAKEAAETLSGSFNSMKAAWKDLLGNITTGGDVSSAMRNLVTSVMTFAKNALPALGNILKSLPVALIGGIAEMGPKLLVMLSNTVLDVVKGLVDSLPQVLSYIQMFFNNIMKELPAYFNNFTALLPEIIQKIVDFASQLFEWLVQALPQFFSMLEPLFQGLIQGIITVFPRIIEALPLLIDGILQFLTTALPLLIEMGINLFTALVQAMPEIIQTIISVLPIIVESIISNLVSMIPKIVDTGVKLLVALIENLPQIIITIVTAVPQIVNSLVQGFGDSIPQIIDSGISLLTSLITNLPSIIVTIVAAVPQIVAAIVKGFANLVGSMVEAGGHLMGGLLKGIVGAVGRIISGVIGVCRKIKNAVCGFFGINSPSKMFTEFGGFLDEGMAIGINKNIAPVEKAIGNLNGAVADNVETDLALGTASVGTSMDIEKNVDLTSQSTQSKIDRLVELAEEYFPILNKEYVVQMDTGSLVGALTPKIDKQMGERARLVGRFAL